MCIRDSNIGLAFQIKDDILSEIGDEKVLGKPTGNDKEKGKCTYVTKYGLEAVSYTHLDVYKRQVSSFIFNSNISSFYYFVLSIAIIVSCRIRCLFTTTSSITTPVSYTHL